MPTKKQEIQIEIPKPQFVAIDLCLISRSPFLCERMSEKAKRDLLMPSGRKTEAEKTLSMKHEHPHVEFRNSAYTLPDSQPTLLGVKAASVKRAMVAAASDVTGVAKTALGRLVWTDAQYGDLISLYGVPRLKMDVVRMANIARTPDIRTWACVPEWAVSFRVNFLEPQLTYPSVLNLLTMAGATVGIGGGRPEKGKLSFGQFEVVDPDNEEFQRIVAEGSYAQQRAAFDDPMPYDEETADLLKWFEDELARRGRRLTKVAA